MIQLKDHSVLIPDSVLYRNFMRREEYLILLVRRLKCIPQLFPIDAHPKIRTRYIHVSNMLDVLRLIKFDTKADRKVAMKSVLAHDIGHTPFGHAGEKAINACLGHGKFFNYQQSQRLISYFEERVFNGTRSIFNTCPLSLDVSFEETEFNSMSTLLDFVDDLENLIGDVKDHMVMYKDHSFKSIAQKFLGANVDMTRDTKELAREIIVKHFSTFDFFRLSEALMKDQFEVFREIKHERRNIIRKSKEIDEIMRFYEDAAHYMQKLFLSTREILNDCYDLDAGDLDCRTIDHVSSLFIEGSSRHLKNILNVEATCNSF